MFFLTTGNIRRLPESCHHRRKVHPFLVSLVNCNISCCDSVNNHFESFLETIRHSSISLPYRKIKIAEAKHKFIAKCNSISHIWEGGLHLSDLQALSIELQRDFLTREELKYH